MRYITTTKCAYCLYNKSGKPEQYKFCIKKGRDISPEEEKMDFPKWCPLPVSEEESKCRRCGEKLGLSDMCPDCEERIIRIRESCFG